MYSHRQTDVGRRPTRRHVSQGEFMSLYEETIAAPGRYVNAVPNKRDRTPNYTIDDGHGTIQLMEFDFDIRNNAVTHHTDEFDITDASVYDRREYLVVRRGQSFNMTMKFNKPYDRDKDNIRMVFQFGDHPLPSRGSHIEVKLSPLTDFDDTRWGAYIKSVDGSVLNLVVTTVPTCAVGKWNLKVDIVESNVNNNESVHRYRYGHPIYLLFNPWCKDDPVYMEDESLLGEYILNETGTLYLGSNKTIAQIPWRYGQFSGNVLDCVLRLLDEKSGLPDHLRGDPIQVVRRISSLVNSLDDKGILVGNWSGNYSDGTSPLDWTGSGDILEEYYKTQSPVKYGQCLTFSGVVTTVCRALGIPCRSVTNFNSAHDTDGSITLDRYFSMDYEEIEGLSQDSAWNYHAWNDVWMSRPDLPPGYGGWQVIDATPQETSGGIFRVGPTSLKAIKQGDVHLNYDGDFVFAEVNSDVVYWMIVPPGQLRIIKKIKDAVGKNISTRNPLARTSPWQQSDGNEREDITEQYKFTEGSAKERMTVERAGLYSTNDFLHDIDIKDVVFELSTDDNTYVGEPLNVYLRVENTGDETRTVAGTVKVATTYYTGIQYKHVFKAKIKSTAVVAGAVKNLRIEVSPQDYLDKLIDHCFLSVTSVCMVQETRQVFAETTQVMLQKPRLTIEAPEKATVGQEFEVKVSFDNTLPYTLTRCMLRVEGPGHQRTGVYRMPDVRGRQKFKCVVALTPVKAGDRDLILGFNSAQMSSISSSKHINITR